MNETDYEALKRILKPVLETDRSKRVHQDSDGLLAYQFRDGTKLSFLCGEKGRLNVLVIQRKDIIVGDPE